jgi:hypothetical protein
MTGYTIDPTQPLPERWTDAIGPMRLMMSKPVKGYVMCRRPGCTPFVLTVADLLGGSYEPVLPKPKQNVREIVSKLA